MEICEEIVIACEKFEERSDDDDDDSLAFLLKTTQDVKCHVTYQRVQFPSQASPAAAAREKETSSQVHWQESRTMSATIT